MKTREYTEADLNSMVAIWNEVVEEGVAFPQETFLDRNSGSDFFASQRYTAAAEENGNLAALYILYPNNIGHCRHIGNASFTVKSEKRGQHIGEKLVKDCLEKAKEKGFRLMQFNAVVESNFMRDIYMNGLDLLSWSDSIFH